MRGDEHLANSLKQMLWEALGHAPPVQTHVRLLVNETRQKLSKRRDKVALEDYRAEGYLAESMVNYLMTLGWVPKGGTEIVPWKRIEEEFRLEDVTHSHGAARTRVAAPARSSSMPPKCSHRRLGVTLQDPGPAAKNWGVLR